MKIVYTSNRYGSGDGPIHDKSFDYLLFRQDWSSNESVYFNKDEIDDVLEKISDGEIPVHTSYSILYCKDEESMKLVDGLFGCYTLVKE
jgi:hypothetical protein